MAFAEILTLMNKINSCLWALNSFKFAITEMGLFYFVHIANPSCSASFQGSSSGRACCGDSTLSTKRLIIFPPLQR